VGQTLDMEDENVNITVDVGDGDDMPDEEEHGRGRLRSQVEGGGKVRGRGSVTSMEMEGRYAGKSGVFERLASEREDPSADGSVPARCMHLLSRIAQTFN